MLFLSRVNFFSSRVFYLELESSSVTLVQNLPHHLPPSRIWYIFWNVSNKLSLNFGVQNIIARALRFVLWCLLQDRKVLA